MALTLLPTAAMAEGDSETPAGGEPTPVEAPVETKVAKVGDVKYDTLAKAVEAATDGATVTLLKDAELTETLNINKAITLDGANHKISGKSSTGNTSFITVKTDGDFTMKNATILPTSKVEKNSAIDLQVKGKVVVDNCVFGAADDANQFMYNGLEFSQSMDYPMADGTTISNCTFYGGSFRHNFISFYRMAEGATININGNKFLNTNWDTTNAIRVSNYSNVNATINLLDDTYNDHGADENKDYAGLLFFQELPTYNDNFTKLTVNIKNLDTTGAQSNQLFYVYKDSIISTNQPVVKGDRSVEKFFVAKVGDTYYKTLAEAVEAAKNDETVTLLKDVQLGQLFEIRKNLTFDLGGKTLSRQGSVLDLYGNVIIKNGTITTTGTGTGAVWMNQTAKLIVEDDVTMTAPADSFAIGYYQDCTAAEVTFKGKITGGNGITMNGLIRDTGTQNKLLVDGANITVDGHGIYQAGYSETAFSINDSVISGTTGIEVRAGKMEVKNSVVSGKGTFTCKANGNGTTTDGAGIAIAQHTTKLPIEVTVSGGVVSGTYSLYESNPQQNSADDIAKIKISVTDGQFNGPVHSDDIKGFISGGLFSSDPSAYVPATHHVEDSGNGSYPFAVKEGAKSDATIIVTAATNATVSETIKTEDKAEINKVINNADVDGVATAIRDDKKAAIAKAAGVTDAELAGKNVIETEITVKVEAKTADLANGKLTFEASPVATVKVNGTATDTTVPVTNDMLNGKPITVKLPLPTVDGKLFTPNQILHKFTGGGYEYFINESVGSKRGAGSFKIEGDCAVFTIYGFSTFELSGTVTYVEPSSGGGSSSSSRRYDVSAPSVKHGDVTVSPKTASKGDTVTITVKPDSGYELDTLTVKDASGSKIKVKDKGDGKFTFTMPASKVTVSAEFAEIETLDFADVSTDAYYYEAVKWAAKKGITGGTGDGTFNPNGSCTRAHIVTFLWRAAGSPEPKSTVSFADVPADSYYAKAVAWAVENGITLGTGDGTFSPNATCTRAQSVTFLYRALGTAPTTVNGFTDVTADAFYADAVAWAVESGVTNGTSASTFSPNNGCTRAQIVTFLYRTMK